MILISIGSFEYIKFYKVVLYHFCHNDWVLYFTCYFFNRFQLYLFFFLALLEFSKWALSRPEPGGSGRSVILKIISFNAILKHFLKTLYNIKYPASTGQSSFKNILQNFILNNKYPQIMWSPLITEYRTLTVYIIIHAFMPLQLKH